MTSIHDTSDIIPQDQPIKVKKKPGRKPNPTSHTVRKEQNRAAQRAYRERKDNHIKNLESSITKLKQHNDSLLLENAQLKEEQEILRSENWYLKGIVLTLQLICYQHHIVIPQHGPYIEEQTMSILAQSIPEPIASYINVNANNKPPISSNLLGYKYAIKQKKISVESTKITKEGVHIIPIKSEPSENKNTVVSDEVYDDSNTPTMKDDSDFVLSLPQKEDENSSTVSPIKEEKNLDSHTVSTTTTDNILDRPQSISDYITTNIAAVQLIRLRLRIEAACQLNGSIPSFIKPTPLQLAVPHDPRIDLISTPFMRDRMILFGDLVNLDEFFDYILNNSVLIGGDPSIAANWRLPAEFYEKYWFLTIDYEFQRVTNNGSRVLQRLDQFEPIQQQLKWMELNKYKTLLKYAKNLTWGQVSSLLGIDLCRLERLGNSGSSSVTSKDYSSPGSVESVSPIMENTDLEGVDVSNVYLQPICLRNANELLQQQRASTPIKETTKKKKYLQHKPQRYHPYHDNDNENRKQPEILSNNNETDDLNDNKNVNLDVVWDAVCSFLQFE